MQEWKPKNKSIFLCMATAVLTLLFAGIPKVQVHAEDLTCVVDGLTWSYTIDESGNATITGCKDAEGNEPAGEIAIPGKVDDYTVTSLGRVLFYENSGLTSVSIPEGVETIKTWAFANCTALESVSLPNSVKTIDDYGFYYCTSLTDITIPKGVKVIGIDAFSTCTSLTSIVIPEGVETIGEYAFHGCRNLKTASLPEGIEAIGDSTFGYCEKLVSVNIPKTVKIIGKQAFTNCQSLTEVIIPEEVKTIEDYAFSTCIKIKHLNIPEGVETIGKGAFKCCWGLTEIIIPTGVKTIGDLAFECCYYVESVTIADGVQTIGAGAFTECNGLTSIVIPASVTTIGEGVLASCPRLTEVYYQSCFEESLADVGDTVMKVSYTINEDGTVSLDIKNLPEECTTITLPEYFKNMTICEITGSEGASVEAQNPPNVPEAMMDVPYAMAKVGDIPLKEGWEWQDSDKEAPLEVGVWKVATAVYTYNSAAVYQNKTASVKIIRLACVHDGENEVKDKKEATCSEEGYTGDICCKICSKKLIIGEKIAKLAHTWDEGRIIKEPTATEAGEKIYICTICHASKSEPVTQSSGSNNDEAASGFVKGTTIQDAKSNAQYKVTGSDKTGAALEYVKPLSNTYKSVVIPATVQVDGVTCKVTSIGKGAFKNNTKLTKITIGSNIKTIGADAFYGCKKLKTVTMGKNVTTIGNRAFLKCTALTKITIPAKVTKIGKQAFYGCKKLAGITIKTTKLTKKNIGSKAFTGTSKNVKVKVPKKKLNSYKKILKTKGISATAKITK